MDAGEYDLVYGTYRNKQHSATRNLGSKSLKVSAKALHTAKGEGSSFRLLTKELASNLLNHRQNFIFLDEVMLWYTDNVGFAEVLHQPRKYDRSGYTFGKLVRLFANLALYYTMVPLKVLVYGGLAISFITFFYGLFFIFKKLVFDVPLGYTSLIVTILFSTSIILFSLGVLGEYLSRMYQIQNGKPPYAIKKVLKRGEKSSQDKL
jgi:undecaprenyl-phosphate 4-deoxy-4-formamido-L-arabinose transferase